MWPGGDVTRRGVLLKEDGAVEASESNWRLAYVSLVTDKITLYYALARALFSFQLGGLS